MLKVNNMTERLRMPRVEDLFPELQENTLEQQFLVPEEPEINLQALMPFLLLFSMAQYDAEHAEQENEDTDLEAPVVTNLRIST